MNNANLPHDSDINKLDISDINDNSILQCSWSNADNKAFYDNLSVEELKGFVASAGLSNNIDLQLIYPFIADSNKILELCAGYGRVVEFCITNNFPGQLVAIERSHNYCNYMQQTFNNKQLRIINTDICGLNINESFDAILWLWSGIAEFAKNEQLPLISNLINLLATDGILAIECIEQITTNSNATCFEGQSYLITKNNANVRGYVPTANEILNYAKLLDLKLIKRIQYQSATHRNHAIYIFKQ